MERIGIIFFKFLIPPDVIPPINTDKHVKIPVHHILVHPATQVPVIGQSPAKSQVGVDWSCGNDAFKKGNSENKCDFKKDLTDKSNNGKSQNRFSDGFGNETASEDNDGINAAEVSTNDDSAARFTVK